jgi:hypothetical protein
VLSNLFSLDWSNIIIWILACAFFASHQLF